MNSEDRHISSQINNNLEEVLRSYGCVPSDYLIAASSLVAPGIRAEELICDKPMISCTNTGVMKEDAKMMSEIDYELQKEMYEKRVAMEEEKRVNERAKFVADMAAFRDTLIAAGFDAEQAWQIVHFAAVERIRWNKKNFLK